jgi:hypothetical protein
MLVWVAEPMGYAVVPLATPSRILRRLLIRQALAGER